jgi:hypothetical protein
MLRDRPQRQCRKEGEAADDEDDADEKDHEKEAIRRQCPGGAGHQPLGAKRARYRQDGYDDEVAADKHRKGERQIVEPRIRVKTGERASIGGGPRRKGIEHLRKAVRAIIPQGRQAGPGHARCRRQPENGERHAEQRNHGHLDFGCRDLLADEFRGTADH